MKKIIYFLFLAILPSLAVFAQDKTVSRTISGIINSPEGLPIAGVTVYVKNYGKQTVSDNKGNFSIAVGNDPDTLFLTHISYVAKKLFINANTPVRLIINMDQLTTEMDEVLVSNGYQKTPKERATGSFTLIDNKMYNEQVGTNVLERLKYVSNGIVPFSQRVGTVAAGQILIRGMSTLTMSIQKPLIIVDNFEYQGDINNINPNDVENVTFLKDAAAGSIWGAKAANGVIVIATKKGKYDQKTKIEFNSNITIIDKPELFSVKSISSGDLIDVEQYLFSKNYRFSDTSSSVHTPFSFVYEILFKKRKGEITAAQADAQINELRNSDVRNDFNKYIYRKAINQQYSLSLRGGSPNIAWVLSGGLDKNINELNAGYNRVNVRFENIYKVVKRLELFTSAYYTQSKTISGAPGYGSINTVTGDIPVYTQLADANGNALPLYTKYRQGYIDTLGGGKLLDWKYYPLEDYKHTRTTTSLQDINAVAGLTYKVFDHLSFDVKYRYERQTSDNQVLYDQQSYYTRNLINNFSKLNWSTGSVKYAIPTGDILDLTTFTTTAQNLRGQVNFNKDWKKNSVVAIAGSEISETVSKNNSYRAYGYNGEILTYTNVDYANTYPLLIGGSDFIPNPAGFGKANTRFLSYYANIAYTFNNKYTLSGSARRDASNIFGVNTNDKWKILWSTGFSWDISKEKFYTIDNLPYLKLRFTYGYQGNVDPSKVAVTTFRYLGTNPYTFTPYSQVRNFVNPDLKWEQAAMTNVGLDFATKSKKISGSIEFYEKKMTDLYGQAPVDVTTGLGTNTIIKNVGTMKGHGFDIELNTINIDRKLRWTTNFIFNSYQDKIIKLLPLPELGNSLVGGGFIGREGYSPFGYFSYKWAGLDPASGDPQGYLNGVISKNYNAITNQTKSSDLTYTGRILPSVYGSMGNTVSWNNISVTARITYKFGYYFRRESINYTSLVYSLRGHSDYALRWQKPGDELSTTVPSFSYPASSSRDDFYSNSEVLATKGDNIRLQYINISYNLNKINLRSLPFQTIQVYVVLNNPGIIWKANKQGLDPDFSGLPPGKTISLGMKVDF